MKIENLTTEIPFIYSDTVKKEERQGKGAYNIAKIQDVIVNSSLHKSSSPNSKDGCCAQTKLQAEQEQIKCEKVKIVSSLLEKYNIKKSLPSELENITKQIRELHIKEGELADRINDLDGRMDEAEKVGDDLTKLQAEQEQIKSEKVKIVSSLNEKYNIRKSLLSELENITKQVGELHIKEGELADRINDLDGRMDEAEKVGDDLTKLQAEQEQIKSEKVKIVSSLNEKYNIRKSFPSELENITKQIRELHIKEGELADRINDLDGRMDEAEKVGDDLTKLQAEQDQIKSEKVKIVSSLNEKYNTRKSLPSELENITKQIRELHIKEGELADRINDLDGRMDEAEKGRDNLKKQVVARSFAVRSA